MDINNHLTDGMDYVEEYRVRPWFRGAHCPLRWLASRARPFGPLAPGSETPVNELCTYSGHANQ